MNKKLIIAGLLAGLVFNVWYTLSWTAFGWHEATWNEFPSAQQKAMNQAITENVPEDGVYVLYPDVENDPNASGPFMMAAIQKTANMDMVTPMISGLIMSLLGGLVLAWLFSKTQGLSGVQAGVFVAVVAFAGGFMSRSGDWNWWGFSFGYTFLHLVDLTIAGFLAGLVIAKVSQK